MGRGYALVVVGIGVFWNALLLHVHTQTALTIHETRTERRGVICPRRCHSGRLLLAASCISIDDGVF